MIGVVGSDPLRRAIAEALDGAVRTGTADAVLEGAPDAVVAVGERSVSELVRAGVEVPVLPAEAGPGLGSVSGERALDVIDRVAAGEYETHTQPVLEATTGSEIAYRGAFDVMLVTSDPGRISEYAVAADDPVACFRADGVVAATPAGSHGYANAAGGPIVASGCLAVVPVAAFAVDVDHWVFDRQAALTLSVERDDNAVSLLVDGRERGRIRSDRPVTVTADGGLEIIAADRDGLEKL